MLAVGTFKKSFIQVIFNNKTIICDPQPLSEM